MHWILAFHLENIMCKHRQFLRKASSGMLRRVALVRIDVTEELSASFIRVTRIGEIGTTLAVTSNRSKLQRNIDWQRATLMMEAIPFSESSVHRRATRRNSLEDGLLKRIMILQSSPLLIRGLVFDSQRYWNFQIAVGLEPGPLSRCEDKGGTTWKKTSGSSLENWN
jgi:hypothetical protein